MEEKKDYLWKVKWIGVLLLLLLLISITKNVKAAERFLWPVPNYTNVYQSYSSKHQGIDISQGGIAGKPVVATKSGVVVAAKDTCNCGDPNTPCNCNGRQGNYVIIKHNDGGLSRYLHLQYGSVSVQVGQSVNRGAQIGLVGSSGESYGYHLHFDLATGSAWNLNNRYNPMNESYEYNIINEPLSISNVRVSDVNSNSYKVSCNIAGNVARVLFPTWPSADDSGNPIWHEGRVNGDTASCVIKKSEHGNKTGTYISHIYAYDVVGNSSSAAAPAVELGKKHQHVYASSIKKPATCTEPGIRLYTCKDNDDSYEEEIPATGHQHTELRNVKAATCAQEGYTGDTYCKDCNTKLASGKVIPKTEHTWDVGKITTVATCSGKGIKTYTCTGCNAIRTEEIPATGHQHTELRNVKAATCAQEGYTGDTYCKDCNTKVTAGKVLPKTDHTWDSGKITTVATCSEKGIKTFTCTVCKSTRIEEIPVTGHVNKITKFAKEASCKSEGYTGDIYCQDCGKLLGEGQVIPKADHVWNKGEITTPATCTTKGIKTYTCASCGTTKTEAIAATGHGATEIRNKKDATTTSEGYTGDTYCTICNQKISSGNTIAKLTPQTATPGKMIKDKSTNGVYKVLQDGVSVEFTKPVYKKVSVRIPDTIKVNGITCKVTGISANAFKNNKSLKSVTIGRNVTVIGTNAFYGCKKLSKVSGGNGIVKIGHRAFANCISLSKITIPGSVRSIGKQAFCNCKKLSSITIKTSTLSGKTVGSKAFAGTYKKPTVKVPAKQMKAYKKLLKVRGMSSKAVYRK